MLRFRPTQTAHIVALATLACCGGDGRAAANDEPTSVADRFESLNRPPGMTIDAWQVRPMAVLRSGYDDNITLSRGDGPSSSELQFQGAVDAERKNGPYVLNLNASFGQSWYPDSPENDTTEFGVGAAVAFDLKPQLLLRTAASFSQGFETGINNGIFVDGVFDPYTTRAKYRRAPFEASFEHQAAALDLQGRAQLTAVEFDSQTTLSGLQVDQDFRSGWEGELNFRSGFRLMPSASLFGETAASTHRFRDSRADRDTWRIAAGGKIELTRLIIGEASIGYTLQSLPDGIETSGLTYGARVHWFVSQLLSLSLNAERSFDAEVVTTASGATSALPISHDVIRLRAEWEPARRLLIFGQAGYEQESREVAGQTDKFTSVLAGATYVLTDSLKVVLDSEFAFGKSDLANDIERHRITLGVTAAF